MPGPEDVAIALKSPYYGLVFLALASQAYTDENKKSSIAQCIYIALTAFDPSTGTNFTPPLPASGLAGPSGASVPPLPGNWSLDWGPAISDDNSNVIYIASYRAPGPNNQGRPYFFSVVIRGTDTSAGFSGLMTQLAEDLRAFNTVSFADTLANGVPNPAERDRAIMAGTIANGSAQGFALIANLKSRLNHGGPPPGMGKSMNVAEALLALTEPFEAGTMPVVVTGHSLGACQAQIFAAYLGWQLNAAQPMIAHAFAPPTPGFADFVQTYQTWCPTSFFWHCEYDVVPYAYVTLPAEPGRDKIRGLEWAKANLWSAYRWPAGAQDQNGNGIGGNPCPSLPEVLVLLIDGLDPLISEQYARPTIGLMPLTGAIPMPQTVIQGMLDNMNETSGDTTSGLTQLMWQHFPPNYSERMAALYADQLAAYQWTSYYRKTS